MAAELAAPPARHAVEHAQFVVGQLAQVCDAMDAPARAFESNHKRRLLCRLTLTPFFAPSPGIEAPLLPGTLKVREAPRFPVSRRREPGLALPCAKSCF
jgi:hypothetical protein